MGLDFGGLLSFGASALGFSTPAVAAAPVQLGVTQGGGQQMATGQAMGGPIDQRAIPIISMILDGMNDSAVRQAARSVGVGKKKMIETLTGIDFATEGQAFTGVQKMFLSNEIEKIWKPRRRSTIPKSLKRSIAQIKWIKKNLKGVL